MVAHRAGVDRMTEVLVPATTARAVRA